MGASNRTQIFLTGIVSGYKVNPNNGKPFVSIFLKENNGTKENPNYVEYHCRLVGQKVQQFEALASQGLIQVGKDNPQFTVLKSNQVKINTQPVQAQALEYQQEQGGNVPVGNTFNAVVTQFVMFDFSTEVMTKKNQQAPAQQQQNAPQATPQQAPAQQPQMAAQAAPQPAQQPAAQPANTMDSFDDDIPF